MIESFKRELQLLTQHIEAINLEQLQAAAERIQKTSGKLIMLGNGGSNGITSHMAEDYSNNYKPTLCFSDSAFMSCFANDYGWEQAFLKWLKLFVKPQEDLVILISSSGASKNILNCAQWCQEQKIPMLTLSGFKSDNPLRQFGEVAFYVESMSYKDVEITHLVILHTLLDILIKMRVSEKGNS